MKTVFEQNIQNDLRRTEQDIDGELLDQLTNIRKQAVRDARPPRRLWRAIWPTTGMTLASILLITSAIVFSPHGGVQVNEQLSDNAELYEDLEFYYWLAENEPDLRG